MLAVAGTIRIGFAGDVHGVGKIANLLAAGGNPLAGMEPLLAANDLNVVNLETAVGSAGEAQDKQYTFHSPPALLTMLKESGVTVVNLANNHSLDFGAAGLAETIADARAAGLQVVGAGADAAEAFAPAFVSTPGGRVAVLGISQVVPPGWAAGPSAPGVASGYDVTSAVNAVRAARAQADHVVVMIHAGIELMTCPTAIQSELVHTLLAAGADVVVGSHPHVLQGIESANGQLIDFSLGDFVWYQNNPPSDLTGLLSVSLGGDGVEGYDFAPAVVGNDGGPVPISGPAADSVRAYVASLAPGAGRC